MLAAEDGRRRVMVEEKGLAVKNGVEHCVRIEKGDET